MMVTSLRRNFIATMYTNMPNCRMHLAFDWMKTQVCAPLRSVLDGSKIA